MDIILLHTHRLLAYVLFLVALVNLVLAMTSARTDPKFAGVLHWSHKLGLLGLGRLTMFAGVALWAIWPAWPITTWWIWVCVLLWGPVEAVGKRLVAPELALARDGQPASSRLVVGAVVQLLCILCIFGLMSARP